MGPNRDNRNDQDNGGGRGSRHRTSNQSHTPRSNRDRYDQDSMDSGYVGSSATTPPQAAKYPGSNGTRNHDAEKGSNADDTDHNKDSDSDYDPKDKYYLTVDDDDYQNMSFRGGYLSNQQEPSKLKDKQRDRKDDHMVRRRPSNHDRHRSSTHQHRSRSTSSSSSGSDSYGYGRHSRRVPSRKYFDSSRSRPRRTSFRRTLSPIKSEPSEDWRDYPEQKVVSNSRSISRKTHPPTASSAETSDFESTASEAEDIRPKKSSDKPRKPRKPRTLKRTSNEKENRRKRFSEGGSSSYKGAADLDDAWYKTFKERLTKGVDMNQVKKVGLDAAAVAAVKVAVGTQMPWKQRIPKTIAVGLAAAVTDFLVSKTSVKPKGMVGTSE